MTRISCLRMLFSGWLHECIFVPSSVSAVRRSIQIRTLRGVVANSQQEITLERCFLSLTHDLHGDGKDQAGIRLIRFSCRSRLLCRASSIANTYRACFEAGSLGIAATSALENVPCTSQLPQAAPTASRKEIPKSCLRSARLPSIVTVLHSMPPLNASSIPLSGRNTLSRHSNLAPLAVR